MLSFGCDAAAQYSADILLFYPLLCDLWGWLFGGCFGSQVGRGLHRQEGHPLCTIKTIIEDHFKAPNVSRDFASFDSLGPVVDVKRAFSDLLIPLDHVSTRPSDTFYVDANTVLRPHTSAHQCELMRAGNEAFLCTGDVFRRDTIDASHYPCFHQMEGVKILPKEVRHVGMFPQCQPLLTGL